ncbi:ribulose-phosphate 3-epimerase [bacterium]|nr:ribulose-phosphate 3-epimerase [bacterium]
MKNHKIGASILSIPFKHFSETYQKIVSSGVDFIHLDIMDGNFVPNLSFSPAMSQEIHEMSGKIPFDVHFMMTSLAYKQTIKAFLAIKPVRVSVHIEAFPSLEEVMIAIKEQHIEFGVALNPDTPIDRIQAFLPQLDFILLMSVNPGFGGQSFHLDVLEKAKTLNQLRVCYGYPYLLEVDGGVQLSLVPALAASGVDLFIIGSDLVKQKDPAEYIRSFRALCQPIS